MTAGFLTAARSTFGYFADGELVGVLLLQTPEVKLSIAAGLRAGLLQFPFRAGVRGAARLIRTFVETEAFKERVMGGQGFIYLDTLGVRLDRAGRGHGGRFLTQVLSDLERTRREPVLLLTHSRRNLAFYRRFGFETAGEHAIGASPITFVAMVRRPSQGMAG